MKKIICMLMLLFAFAANSATIIVDNGFESGNLGGLLCSGNCPTITTSIVSSGTYAADFTLTQQMNTNFRTEATFGSNGVFQFGVDYSLELDYLHEDWDEDSNAEMSPFQIHTRASDYSAECALGSAYSTAPFFMLTQNNVLKFITYGGNIMWTGNINKGNWSNIKVYFKASSSSDGYIEAWRDGVFLGRVEGANGPKVDKCGKDMKTPYFKMGVYKWDWKRKTTDSTRRRLIIDNVKIVQDPLPAIEPEEPTLPPTLPPTEAPAPSSEELIWALNTVVGDGIAFNGTTSLLDIGALQLPTTAITVLARIKSTDLTNCNSSDCRIISKAVGLSEQDHYLMLSTIKVGSEFRLRFRLKLDGVTTTLIADSGNISVDTWTNIAAVYDGRIMSIYVNGIPAGDIGRTGSISTNPEASLWLGDNPPDVGSRPWKGYIDDIQIYNYALTQCDIEALAAQ